MSDDPKIIKCVVLTKDLVEKINKLSPTNHSKIIRLILKKYFDSLVG